VRVRGETADAAKPPFAEVKVFQEPVKDTAQDSSRVTEKEWLGITVCLIVEQRRVG
jgi:hypothetical protein